jgi:hypothetical protein
VQDEVADRDRHGGPNAARKGKDHYTKARLTADHLERSEHTEHAENDEVADRVDEGCVANQHENEIKDVERVAEVGVLRNKQPHGQLLQKHLGCEGEGEEHLRCKVNVRPVCNVLICSEADEETVEHNNNEHDGLEVATMDDVNSPLSEDTLGAQAASVILILGAHVIARLQLLPKCGMLVVYLKFK